MCVCGSVWLCVCGCVACGCVCACTPGSRIDDDFVVAGDGGVLLEEHFNRRARREHAAAPAVGRSIRRGLARRVAVARAATHRGASAVAAARTPHAVVLRAQHHPRRLPVERRDALAVGPLRGGGPSREVVNRSAIRSQQEGNQESTGGQSGVYRRAIRSQQEGNQEASGGQSGSIRRAIRKHQEGNQESSGGQ